MAHSHDDTNSERYLHLVNALRNAPGVNTDHGSGVILTDEIRSHLLRPEPDTGQDFAIDEETARRIGTLANEIYAQRHQDEAAFFMDLAVNIECMVQAAYWTGRKDAQLHA